MLPHFFLLRSWWRRSPRRVRCQVSLSVALLFASHLKVGRRRRLSRMEISQWPHRRRVEWYLKICFRKAARWWHRQVASLHALSANNLEIGTSHTPNFVTVGWRWGAAVGSLYSHIFKRSSHHQASRRHKRIIVGAASSNGTAVCISFFPCVMSRFIHIT